MRRYVAIAVVGLTLRLILAAVFPGNWDQDSYLIVARIVEHGGNVYAETTRYNYAPIWMYVLAGLDLTARVVGVRFDFLTRAFLAVVDLADAVFIAGIAKRSNLDSRLAFVAFILNPVSILLTGLHGQFEDLAALPLLLGAYLALGKAPRGWLWSFAALALTVKHILVFAVWDWLFWFFGSMRRAALAFAGSLLAFGLTFAPFLPAGAHGILLNVVLYHSIGNWYGVGLLPPPLPAAVFVIGMGGCLLVAQSRRWPIDRRLSILALAFVALTPGMGEQYLMLVPIFASFRPSRWLPAWSAVAAIAIIGFQPIIHDPRLPLDGSPWLLLFLVSVGWLVWILAQRPIVQQPLREQSDESHEDRERELSLNVGR